jgi:hypothetical protein
MNEERNDRLAGVGGEVQFVMNERASCYEALVMFTFAVFVLYYTCMIDRYCGGEYVNI